jgi:hypothetical protein
MYVAGGADSSRTGLSVTERFRLSTNSWTTLAPLPQAAFAPGSAFYKGLLYCFGGWTAYQGTVLNNSQIYHP